MTGRGLPHDLAQFIIERELGHRYGYWGCMADGATFRSLVKAGRPRTSTGAAIIAKHAYDLDAAEAAAHVHAMVWRNGPPTQLTPVLERMRERWEAMTDGDSVELDFPLVIPRASRSVSTPDRGWT